MARMRGLAMFDAVYFDLLEQSRGTEAQAMQVEGMGS